MDNADWGNCDLSQVKTKLSELNISIFNDEGEFKTLRELFSELAEGINGFTPNAEIENESERNDT